MKRTFSLIICIILLCICVVGCQKQSYEKREKIIVGYGDDFSEIPLFNVENKEEYLKSSKKYRLVFVMDPLCGACKKQLQIINNFRIFYEPYLDVSIVWENSVVEDGILEQYNIPKYINYLLGIDGISITTPTVLIVGKDNKVCFESADMESIALKLNTLEGVSIEMVRRNVCNYFNKINPTDKRSLIYFALQGCSDCEKADKIIDKDIEEKYDVMKIYDNASYGEEEYVDIDNIYQAIFNIDWYPSFLILEGDNEYQLVGKTDVQKLKNTLLNL